MTQDITSLIEKLEGADAGSQEIDAAICILFQYGGPNSEGATNVRTDEDWEGDLLFEQYEDECCNRIPAITTSLDAALALAERVVGEEFALSLLQDTVDGWNAAAGLSIRNLPRLLCAALLRGQSEAR